jgi:aldose 1-epimerase
VTEQRATPVPPSGRQHRLARGDQELVVVEVGGGIRAYRAGGRDVLDGYGSDEMCSGGRGQVLVPWPNRLRDGRYEFGGTAHQLDLSEPGHGNAIHGLVRWASWTATEQTGDRLVMRHLLHPRPGYPFTLDLAVEYELADDGLTARLTATNVGRGPCPVGAGAHPYLTLGTARVDGLVLTAPGATRLLADDRGLPAGAEPVDGGRYDFRRPRAIGDQVLDTCFTDLARDADGRAHVRLEDPATGRRVALWLDGAHRHLMLFTGESLADPARRRRGLAVEPMTCAPDALASGDGLTVLAPRERLSASWGITVGG